MTKEVIFDGVISDESSYKGKKIAVHIHAFYVDLLPLYAEYLRNIHEKYDLYISIPELVEYNEKKVTELFSEDSKAGKIDIRQTPNKGRDIAPLLCTFKEELQKYDILLHLHTKKSPHDKAYDMWGIFMLEHLLQDKDCVEKVLTLLSTDCYFVASTDFLRDPSSTGWGNKECNLEPAQRVIDRSDLNINLSEEYPVINYPQGSFFWCRTDALCKLFNIGLTYDDFPEEPIGVDGSIAHAIERLFFVWGRNLKTSDGKPMRWIKSKTYWDVIDEKRITKLKEDLSYSQKKNRKHLKQIRIYITVCIALLLTTLALICLLFFE